MSVTERDAELRQSRLGVLRVVEPKGVLPQAARRVDNDTTKLHPTEVRIAVERLNIDSASFVQMEAGADDKAAAVVAAIRETVAARGKQHNPVTGSGGMLLGSIVGAGPHADLAAHGLAIGDRVATLVSLTLTPLRLEAIAERDVDLVRHQVGVRGEAILFDAAGCAKLPSDLPETVALSALDVAGAAPQAARLTPKTGLASALILGCGGKSGLLCSAAIRHERPDARIVGVERSEAAAEHARRLGACDTIVIADAGDALAVSDALGAVGVAPAQLTISCVNVPNAEMSAILNTVDDGTIYFFSMATSFTQAALGAEGVVRDVNMIVGNGYCKGHARYTLELLRADAKLRAIFVERYG